MPGLSSNTFLTGKSLTLNIENSMASLEIPATGPGHSGSAAGNFLGPIWLRSTEEMGISGNCTTSSFHCDGESQTECYYSRKSWTRQKFLNPSESCSCKATTQSEIEGDKHLQEETDRHSTDLPAARLRGRQVTFRQVLKAKCEQHKGSEPCEPQTKGEFILAQYSVQRFAGASRERRSRAPSVVGVCRRNTAATSRKGKKPHLILLPYEPKGSGH